MKKIATLLSIPVALVVAWGGTSWFVGQQTETTVRQFIDQQNQQAAGRGVVQLPAHAGAGRAQGQRPDARTGRA